MSTAFTEAAIEADPDVPAISIPRDFAAPPERVLRAHTDPALFAQWVGPVGMDTRITEWDARDGGAWSYVSARDGEEYAFRGCFHRITGDTIVQTFSYQGAPDDVALETLHVDDLGGGRSRLRTRSLVDSFEQRDAWLRSGMEKGVNGGYAKLDALLAGPAGAPAQRLAPAGEQGVPLTGMDPAERHRAVAAAFTARVAGVGDWSAPAPVPGWAARDVVGHLVSWIRDFLAVGGVELPPLPEGVSVEADPPAAWRHHTEAVQALLGGPEAAEPFTHPYVGTFALADAVDRFYTADVFQHTWDLARATGQDDRLDPGFCAELLDGMRAMEGVLRSSGQFGPAVPVADDAPVQEQLIGFIGRDPAWRPTAR